MEAHGQDDEGIELNALTADESEGRKSVSALNYRAINQLAAGNPPSAGDAEIGLLQRSQSQITMSPEAMSAMSVVALFQSHDEEGLNSEQVERKRVLHGPNSVNATPTCCAVCPFSCWPIKHPRRPAALSLSITLPSTYLVVRDAGEATVIAISALVPGDLVVVNVGDVLPADVRIISDDVTVMVDNSVFTGDTTPVERNCEADCSGRVDPGLVTNMLYCGASVRATSAPTLGLVVATGAKTALASMLLDEASSSPQAAAACTIL